MHLWVICIIINYYCAAEVIFTNLLRELKIIGKAKEFAETKNYYYDYHICPNTGENEKVMLDFTLKNDLTDEILRFGMCQKCGLCCYHKDYQGKDF